MGSALKKGFLSSVASLLRIVAPDNSLVIKPTVDSATAIQFQDKDDNAILTVDTTNNKITIDHIDEGSSAHGVVIDGVTLKDGGIDISGALAASGNIKFPASQNASADANTLDDYEEGTWTPVQGAGLTIVGEFASSGTYMKIGRIVVAIGKINPGTSVACTGNGGAMSNVPFTPVKISVGAVTDNNQSIANNIAVSTNSVAYCSGGNISATAALYFTIVYEV